MALGGVLKKLRSCKHTTLGLYRYVRDDGDDGSVEEGINKTYQDVCLDCGSYRRQREGREPEPWLAPWIWRNNG